MSVGLFGFLLKNKNIIDSIENLFPKFSGSYIYEEINYQHTTFGRKVLNKLHNDRFIKENEQYIIGFEGVNLSEHIQNFNDFIQNFQKNGINFVSNLRGVFNGFVFDKENEKLYLFTDNLATKRFYYYYDAQYGFAFAPSLQVLTKLLAQQNIPYHLNRDAVYMMALYGIILEDHTYVNQIKNLNYGTILSYDLKNNDVSTHPYLTYHSEVNDISYSEAIDKIEELLTRSIDRSWKKNKQYSSEYLTFLSGGMDARVNALIANELGYKPINSLTFGQSNSKDVAYGKKIASGEGFNHKTVLLDKGEYLIDDIYNNYIIPNDGMMFYNSSANASYSIKKHNLGVFPIMHTGQIGDVLFGSFIKKNFDFQKNKANLGYTGFVGPKHLLEKIKSLDDILAKYQNRGYELYIYEQRQINGTIMGDRSNAHLIDSISPFYDPELIQFCISLPASYKTYQRIYFDWLKKYHPQVLNYPWDKIEMKPNHYLKVKYGKIFKKYYNGFKKYFNLRYESMNPFGLWLKENPMILKELDNNFDTYIKHPVLNIELKDDLRLIYQDDIFEARNKFAVVTVLLALKLHFPHHSIS